MEQYQAVPNAGGCFSPACKPGSRGTPYERIQRTDVDELRTGEGKCKQMRKRTCPRIKDIPVRDGKDALKVNRFEADITSMAGRRTNRSTFAADMEVGGDNQSQAIGKKLAIPRFRTAIDT